LRQKLLAGENIPLIENFVEKEFLAKLHKKYAKWWPDTP